MKTPVLFPENHHAPWVRVGLEKSQVTSCHLAAGQRLALRALTGCFWVTLEGNPADHVLQAGESQVFTGPGLLVMESLKAFSLLLLEDENSSLPSVRAA